MIKIRLFQKGTRSLQMTNRELKIYHRAFGAHSNIPECCVEFFVNQWDMQEGWSNENNWYHQAVNVARFGYVPCPPCLGLGNKAIIKLCDDECGGQHRSDFMPTGFINVY